MSPVTDDQIRHLAGSIILRWVNHETELGDRMLNTHGFGDFPPEVQAHVTKLGRAEFIPARVLALFALGREREIEPPTEEEHASARAHPVR